MSDFDRDGFLWNVHSYINEYIRFADTKAELVIGWITAITGGLLAVQFQKKLNLCHMAGIASSIGFGLLVLSFVFAFLVLLPRLRTSQPKGFIFWRSIRASGSRTSLAQV